jgi:hypothetical protein
MLFALRAALIRASTADISEWRVAVRVAEFFAANLARIGQRACGEHSANDVAGLRIHPARLRRVLGVHLESPFHGFRLSASRSVADYQHHNAILGSNQAEKEKKYLP